jgi:hypothetical protein
MDKSLRIRKEKILARRSLARRLASGKVRLEQVSLAVAFNARRKPPLVFPRVEFPDYEAGW